MSTPLFVLPYSGQELLEVLSDETDASIRIVHNEIQSVGVHS